jgi:hypothetical protein
MSMSWPEDAVVRIAPFSQELHDETSEGYKGRCNGSDATHRDATPANWSVVWQGQRWALCDAHIPGFLRSETAR